MMVAWLQIHRTALMMVRVIKQQESLLTLLLQLFSDMRESCRGDTCKEYNCVAKEGERGW